MSSLASNCDNDMNTRPENFQNFTENGLNNFWNSINRQPENHQNPVNTHQENHQNPVDHQLENHQNSLNTHQEQRSDLSNNIEASSPDGMENNADDDVVIIQDSDKQKSLEGKPTVENPSHSQDSRSSPIFPKWEFYKGDKTFLIIYESENLCKAFRRSTNRNNYYCYVCKHPKVYAYFKTLEPEAVPKDFPLMSDHHCDSLTLEACYKRFERSINRKGSISELRKRHLSPIENLNRKSARLDLKPDVNNIPGKSSPVSRLSDKAQKKRVIQNTDFYIMIKDHNDDFSYRKFVQNGNKIICSYCRAVVELNISADGSKEVVGEHIPKCKLYNSYNKQGVSNATLTTNSSNSNGYNPDDKKVKSDSGIKKSSLRIKEYNSFEGKMESHFEIKDDALHVDGRVYDDHSRGKGTRVYLCTECLVIGRRVEAEVIQCVKEEEHCEDCENGMKTVKQAENDLQEKNTFKKVKFGENTIRTFETKTESDFSDSELEESRSDESESSDGENTVDKQPVNEELKTASDLPETVRSSPPSGECDPQKT